MTYAGATQDIFSDGADDDIFRFASGAARLINKVCTHALIYGAQNKHRIIDDHMIKRVIQEELSCFSLLSYSDWTACPSSAGQLMPSTGGHNRLAVTTYTSKKYNTLFTKTLLDTKESLIRDVDELALKTQIYLKKE